VTREHAWLNNGDLVQAREHGHRLIFLESENLDPLFDEIGKLIGLSVEPILFGAVRRAIRMYLKRFVTDEMRQQISDGRLSIKAVDDGFRELARPLGYGNYEFVAMRCEGDLDDFFTVSITEPFSVTISAASHCAAMEAITGADHTVECENTAPDRYEIRAFPSPHPEAFEGRMRMERYRHKEGDIELLRCSTCGGPMALSVCRWHPERGIIINELLQRRMAMLGAPYLEVMFEELENELGDSIPSVIVEAQRRFTGTGFYSINDVKDASDFRTQLALRGVGNLREFRIGGRGVRMEVHNVAIPYMVIGMMQGIFERTFDMGSMVDWELADGNLIMEVTPAVFGQ
jgi:hypothetical protein